MAETSYAKTEERVRCLLGWMDDVTQGEIFQGQAPRLELIFWEKRHILIQYIHFLSDRRQLAVCVIDCSGPECAVSELVISPQYSAATCRG